MQKRNYFYFWINAWSLHLFFPALHAITLQNSWEWRIHFNWEDSTADSDVAEQTGRLSPLRNGWKREHESTFLDSDWPSFNNAVYAFSPSLSLSPFQTVERPNQSCKVKIKVLLWKVTGSHRTADCCTPARGGCALMTTVFQSRISIFGGEFILILSNPLTSNLCDLHILLFFDKQLPPRHPVASFSPCISCFNSIFRKWACWDGKPACRLILRPILEWHKVQCRARTAH